jgi:hypothetical protein
MSGMIIQGERRGGQLSGKVRDGWVMPVTRDALLRDPAWHLPRAYYVSSRLGHATDGESYYLERSVWLRIRKPSPARTDQPHS